MNVIIYLVLKSQLISIGKKGPRKQGSFGRLWIQILTPLWLRESCIIWAFTH